MGSKDPSIQFLGAAGTVTGSRTLVEFNDQNVLVDCGLFQGPREIRELNWQEFNNVDKIDAVILTHAHIDHSGFLPKIVRQGYRGPIYCSKGTKALCQILLPDAGRLQEEDARFANEKKHSRHDPALPLFTEKDAYHALEYLQEIKQDQWQEFLPGAQMRLIRSGHILGSTFVQLSVPRFDGNHVITFSGDIGNDRSNILKPPKPIDASDTLVLESTYGDRRQSRRDPKEALSHIINKVINRGGTLIIPAFAVGRTQELIYLISELEEQGEIENVPVYVDSPMALNATKTYLDFAEDLRLDINDKGKVESALCCKDYRAVNSAEESMLLCMSDEPKVVISAAGMLSGGRVLHHLKQKLPDPKNAVLFVGYQAEGTKGRLLRNGLPELSIHHQLVTVEAEIFVIDGLSAHGDCEDIMNWLGHFKEFPKKIFLNHGEAHAARALKYMIESHYDVDIEIPRPNDRFSL